MRSARTHSHRADRRHRRTLAIGVIGTAGGLAALFHVSGLLGTSAASGTAATMVPAAARPAAAAAAGRPTMLAAEPARPRKAGGAAAKPVTPATKAAAKAGGGPVRSGPKTILGPAVDTRWGTVQVKLTVQGGKITMARTVQSPHASGTSLAINARALPILNGEAVHVQSARIDAVSGATVTSGGYLKSLQVAVDQAHVR